MRLLLFLLLVAVHCVGDDDKLTKCVARCNSVSGSMQVFKGCLQTCRVIHGASYNGKTLNEVILKRALK